MFSMKYEVCFIFFPCFSRQFCAPPATNPINPQRTCPSLSSNQLPDCLVPLHCQAIKQFPNLLPSVWYSPHFFDLLLGMFVSLVCNAKWPSVWPQLGKNIGLLDTILLLVSCIWFLLSCDVLVWHFWKGAFLQRVRHEDQYHFVRRQRWGAASLTYPKTLKLEGEPVSLLHISTRINQLFYKVQKQQTHLGKITPIKTYHLSNTQGLAFVAC